MALSIPNFPGIGPIGAFTVIDATSNAAATVYADNGLNISGPVLLSILAEMQIQSQLLKVIANVPDDLRQMRLDAIADMGTLYTAPYSTPLPSS